MNQYKTIIERQEITTKIISAEPNKPKLHGFNPITGGMITLFTDKGDISPNTLFLEALRNAGRDFIKTLKH